MVAHRRNARVLASVALITAVAAVTVVGLGAMAIAPAHGLPPGRTVTGTPKPPAATAAARRRRARLDAANLVARLRLAAGAVELSREPSGDGGLLRRPASKPATPALVDEHAWWRVPGSAASVLDYLSAHAPQGGKLTQSGSQGPLHGKPIIAFVGFSWPPVAKLLAVRQLLVQAVDLSGGDTGVRADAQVQWIVPRPASERIPRGVHEIDVTRGAPGQAPTLSIKVLAANKIRALVAMVDGLEIVQPGAYSCPSSQPGAPVVTFTFRASDGGTVLARASQLAAAREPTTPCDPMTFSMRGHPRTPLLGGARVLTEASRLLGVRLHTRAG